MAKEYLLTHPKVLIEVSQKLQQREQQEQAMKTAVIQHQTALTNDKEMLRPGKCQSHGGGVF